MDDPHPPNPLQLLAQDMGVDPSTIEKGTLSDIFKHGPNSALFIARVSQVYTHSSHLTEEMKSLRAKLEDITKKHDETVARCTALERVNSRLERENEYYLNQSQNSVLSAVFFALGSIAVGIAGSYFAQKDYQPAVLAGIIGVALSVFATYKLLSKSTK